MTMTEVAAGVILAAAALTGFGVLFKWLRGGFRTVEDGAQLLAAAKDIRQLVAMSSDIKALVERELNHNHGSSMKDDAYGTAISVRLAHERIDGIHDVLRTFADANHLVLPIIADAINANPPNERTTL